jgi:hypothetical protein
VTLKKDEEITNEIDDIIEAIICQQLQKVLCQPISHLMKRSRQLHDYDYAKVDYAPSIYDYDYSGKSGKLQNAHPCRKANLSLLLPSFTA